MDEKLTLALVASASAIGGVFLTQAFTFIRELIISKHAKEALLREKYELLTDKLSESILQKQKFDNSYDTDTFSNIANPPIEKILTLSLLYFPELTESSKCYYNAYRAYLLILLKNHKIEPGLSVSMQVAKYGGHDFDVALEKLHLSQTNLYKSIHKYAQKYARP